MEALPRHRRKNIALGDASIDGLSVQLNSLTSLAARLVAADFAALLWRQPKQAGMKMVSHDNRLKGTSMDSRPVEEKWAKTETVEAVEEKCRAGLNQPVLEKTAPQDQFAVKHGFHHSCQFPILLGERLEGVVVAYWCGQPELDLVAVAPAVGLILSAVGGLNRVVNQFEKLTNYSVGLYAVAGMSELAGQEKGSEELLTDLVAFADGLVPSADFCVIGQDRRSGKLRLKDYVGNEPPAQAIVAALTGLRDSTGGKPDQDAGPDHVWADLVITEGDPPPYATAALLADEPDDKMYLVAWRRKPERFSSGDRQLLATFARAAATLLDRVRQAENLKRANRVLKKSSQRLASNETLAALADMTSGLAHDFNNIIGAVIGRVQLMKLRVADKNFLRDLDKIENLLLDGAQTVRRIQEFSTSAKYKDLQQVDLVEVVRTYLDDTDARWQRLAAEKNVSVGCSALLNAAEIEGSSKDLGKIVEKLVENAVEHSFENHRVEVIVADTGKHFSLSVMNYGPVISDDLKKKIFYPFFSTKPQPGSGLGLAMVQGVVARHNGKIRVESGEGANTVFEVTFPKYSALDEDSDITHRTKNFKELHVLVVDDDDQIREVLADMFTVNGHKVTSCCDGYSALEAFRQEAFDLVITDLGMAGMSGLDLAGLVHEEKPDIPIAMITGWGSQLNHDEIALKGIRAVLAKPFHLKEITALVEQLVEV
ncbi:MAG: hybrid sensor histidine kinase/response regulator [Candidatus Zixiibacteriota bacterium]|nr:MAG: hybrid sensor histidine kinase/response regulator [candidate division Zixibacteria bacterium]